jgi:peptidoglycan-N-acetylglucosamine deacetylase
MRHIFLFCGILCLLMLAASCMTNQGGAAATDPVPQGDRIVVLTFDDAVINHRTFVAPLLKELGFGATFFPCRWDESWREKWPGALMGGKELKELEEMGFEIGNHTWLHSQASRVSLEDFTADVAKMEEFLAQAGVARPRSFAYPCGESTPEIQEMLRNRGYRCARTVANDSAKGTDSMNLPAACIHDGTPGLLEEMLSLCKPGAPIVLLYHGVPEIAHPWVNRDPEGFRQDMALLKKEGVRVLSVQQFLDEQEK